MASIRPDQLPAQLARSLAPVYLIAGAEPLLVQECRDQVIRAAQAQGFVERDLYEADSTFDWESLLQGSANLSLFSSRRIVDLRLPTGKPGRDGARVLGKLAADTDPDRVLILSCDQWDGSSRKSKWAAQLAAAGMQVQIWPVKPNELPGWIKTRMSMAGLQPEPQAVALLAELVEGNLLAAQQEIDKLVLLDCGARVTVDHITRAVTNSARFDAFRLVDCALQGRLGECLRVAAGLRRIDVAIQMVTGALYRELLTAESAARAVQSGQDESSVFRRLGVWQARQASLREALCRLTVRDFGEAFHRLSLIDRQSKGRAAGDPWQALDRLLCLLCEPRSARAACSA
ncbi:MAG: DNA polymerase III subunit delta [Xanthomonadales bacterium]|nr:DNA polymerase III subunit delta [Xanthomonadales bacterium]